MDKARKHRDAELNRLRVDQQAAAWLEREDHKVPVPSSSGPFPTGSSVDIFRERWRQLVAIPKGPADGTKTSEVFDTTLADPSMHTTYTSQPTATFPFTYSPGISSSNMTFRPMYISTSGQQAGQTLESTNTRTPEPATTVDAPSEFASGQTVGPDWSDGRTTGPGAVPWPWANDADPSVDMFTTLDLDAIDVNMDFDGEVDWYNWVESAKGIEWDGRA